MASYEKEDNVFTRNPMGGEPGESKGLKREKGGNVGGGGTVLSAYPQDNVHGVDLPNTTGDSMAGGPSNLSATLRGASAVQRQSGKPERSGI
jgi:hypothetical protein